MVRHLEKEKKKKGGRSLKNEIAVIGTEIHSVQVVSVFVLFFFTELDSSSTANSIKIEYTNI